MISIYKLRDKVIEEMNKHSPSYPQIKRRRNNDSHLLVIDPADIHIGKLATSFETGEDYNSQIAVKRVKEGVAGIINKSQGFNIDKILFIGGNDILHIDVPSRKTTSGTPQDTDGMWYVNFLTAKKLYVDILEILLDIADVHFVYNPSNHDYMSGFMLSDSIKSWFRKCDNITFDCSIAHRKGYKYGKNLIGTTHGDGAKVADLPLIMANEFSKPVITSSKISTAPYSSQILRRPCKNPSFGGIQFIFPATGSTIMHPRNKSVCDSQSCK